MKDYERIKRNDNCGHVENTRFYNNLKVVISDLENTRRKAGMMADAPLKRHPIDRLQE